MTFLHFVNCVALTYAPHYLTYKFSALSEDTNCFKKCAIAGFGCILTKTLKMFILASIFPSGYSGDEATLFQLFMKTLVDMMDILGVYFLLNQFLKGDRENKILSVIIGWSLMDAVISWLFPLFFGARGHEFDWKYIQMAIQANIYLVHYVSFVRMIYLWSRKKDAPKDLPPTLLFSLIVLSRLDTFILEVLSTVLEFQSHWITLFFQATTQIGLAFFIDKLYLKYTSKLK